MNTQRTLLLGTFTAITMAVALTLPACGGGSSYGSSSPSAPSSGSSGSTASVTVNIVGIAGSQAYSPNPISVPTGQTVAFRNSTSSTHHLVQDGGGWDLGDIAPGATSRALSISTANQVAFHCANHPSMVGTINGAVTPPNSGGGDGGTPPGY